MKSTFYSRRDLLKTGAAATSMIAMAAAAPQAQAQQDKKPFSIGVATTNFRTHTNAQLAQELAAAGIDTIQLFLTQTDSKYWVYNTASDVSDLNAARCREIADTYRSAGLSIHSIGVYANLVHPDPAERKANLAYFDAMMQIGAHMDVRKFISEAGHYNDPEEPTPRVAHHFQEAVWQQMLATGKELAKMAEGYDATVLLEPFFAYFLSSAKRTRVFIEEVGSPHVRALLDPANLLEVNDLREMFDQLGPYIDCLHAKDRKLHVERGVAAGQCDLDYVEFVRLAAERTPHAPMVLEYVGANDYQQALAHLKDAMKKAGLPAA